MKNTLYLAVLLISAILFPSSSSHGDSSRVNDPDNVCSTMTAKGQLQNGDLFTGRLDSTGDGKVDGVWYHQTPKGDRFQIRKVDWVVTPIVNNEDEKAGPEFAKFGGRGTWNNIQGYTFRVHTRKQDPLTHRGYYEISIFGPDGRVFYDSAGYVTEGDIENEGFYCSSLE